MVAYLLIEITPHSHEDMQFKKIKKRNILLLLKFRDKREAIIQLRIARADNCYGVFHPASSLCAIEYRFLLLVSLRREKRSPERQGKFIAEVNIEQCIQEARVRNAVERLFPDVPQVLWRFDQHSAVSTILPEPAG